MILMPLAPQLMRLFEIDPRQFGFLVSAYTFAAAASGFVAAFWIDRFGRKRALLGCTRASSSRPRCAASRPSYELLLAARIVAGDLRRRDRRAGVHDHRRRHSVRAARARHRVRGGGVLARRRHGRAARAVVRRALLVARAVSRARRLSAVGVDRRVARRACRSTRTSPAASAAGPLAQLAAVFGVANHLRAFAFMIVLMTSVFMVVPVHRRVQRRQRGHAETELPYIYFAGGLAALFTAPAHRSARRPLRQEARVHDPRVRLARCRSS